MPHQGLLDSLEKELKETETDGEQKLGCSSYFYLDSSLLEFVSPPLH